jgi:hypothetical protein
MTTNPFPYTDASIDLETLGQKYNAPIVSIGAVAFNRETGKIGTTFYQEIDIDSSLKIGTVTTSTLCWWLNQNKNAKQLFDDSAAGRGRKMHIASALLNFTTFVRSLGAPRVWGNGATFDITILEHSIDKGSVGLSPPWVFWNIRDMRTLVDAAESIKGWKKESVEAVGTHHNALDAATYQAKVIIHAWAALGDKPPPVAKPSAGKKGKPVVIAIEDDDDEL